MSDFMLKLLGKSVEKELSAQPNASPVDVILKNPVVKSMLKSYRKEIVEGITAGEKSLINAIEQVELLPGEFQIAPVLDMDFDAEGQKEIRLLVVSFDNQGTIMRTVADIPLRDFILTWIQQKIK